MEDKLHFLSAQARFCSRLRPDVSQLLQSVMHHHLHKREPGEGDWLWHVASF